MKRKVLLVVVLGASAIGLGRLWKANTDPADPPPQPTPLAAPAAFKPPAGVARAPTDVQPLPVLPNDLPSRGNLRLQGQVVDADELPVEGASVTVDLTPPASVSSERDGSFVFSHLPPGAYQLQASKGNAVAGPLGIQLAAHTEPVTLRLAPGQTLQFTVLDGRDRKRVDGALIELRGINVLTVRSDTRGEAQILGVPAGRYSAKVSAEGFAPTWHSLQISGSTPVSQKVTIELHGGAGAAGTVVDAAGKPLGGVRVLPEGTSSLSTLLDIQHDAAISDDAGRWRLSALAAGTYRFRALSEKYAPGVSQPIHLDGERAREGIVIALPPNARIAGKVVTADGKPAPFATVRAVVDDGDVASARQAVSNQLGEFDLQGLPPKWVQLAAVHEVGNSITRNFDLRTQLQQMQVTLVLDAGESMAGVVQSSKGEPVTDAIVVAEPLAQSARTRAEMTLRGALAAVADAGGRFELRGLVPGGYLLRAAPPGTPLKRRVSWLRSGVKAQAGSRGVRITLDRDGAIKGHVQKETGEAPESFTISLGSLVGPAFSGTSGEFNLTSLPAGTHALTVSGPDFVTKTVQAVEVKPDEQTELGTLVVQNGRRVSGRVRRTDGTGVAGASVIASKRLSGPGVMVGPTGAVMAETKQTTSRDDGTFLLEGVGITPLSVAADHPSEGKSSPSPVAEGVADVEVDLVLRAVGALEGEVTRHGDPVGGAKVVASMQGAPAGGTAVNTGTDGRYHFDSLSPGSYAVIAVLDNGGGQQMKRAQTTVKAGETAHCDLDVPRGEITVVVTATASEGGPDRAQVVLAEQRGSAASGSASSNERPVHSQMISVDTPARFPGMSPGHYELCVVPGPPGPPDAGTRTGSSCRPLLVAEQPALQQVTIQMPSVG